MRLNTFASSTLLLAACALIPQAAAAFGSYPNDLPNGNINRCANCHVSPAGGGARTPFGEDVLSAGNGVEWSALYDLDSDGDGQSNGEELGDPCGEWDSGAAPRTTDISNPGLVEDTSADPNTPACLPDEVDAGPIAEPAVEPAAEPAVEPAADAGPGEPDAEPADDAGPGEPDAEPSAEPEESEPEEPAGPCNCTNAPNNNTAYAGMAFLALAGLVTFRRRRR